MPAFQTFAVREYQAEELFRRGHELRKAGFQSGRVEGPKAALEIYRDAAGKLGEAFALAPYRGEFAYYAGCCHLEMGRLEGSEKRWLDANASLEEALRFYDRAALTTPGPVLERDRAEAQLMLANLFQERQEREAAHRYLLMAEESLQKAAWMNPSEPEFSFLLGQLYWRIGDASRALEVWAGAVRRIPYFADERLIPVLREWEVKGRVRDAWNLAWAILDANPEQVSAWQAADRLGWALGGEEPDRVIDRLMETIREERKPNLHLLMLAANHAFQSGDFQESEEQLNRLLEIHPLNVNALVLKCAILRNSGREELALATLRERIQTVKVLQPQNWKLFVELADTIRKVEGESAARDFLWGLMDDPRFSVLEYRKKVLELLGRAGS